MLLMQPAWLSCSIGLQVLGLAAEEHVGWLFIKMKGLEDTAFVYSCPNVPFLINKDCYCIFCIWLPTLGISKIIAFSTGICVQRKQRCLSSKEMLKVVSAGSKSFGILNPLGKKKSLKL